MPIPPRLSMASAVDFILSGGSLRYRNIEFAHSGAGAIIDKVDDSQRVFDFIVIAAAHAW